MIMRTAWPVTNVPLLIGMPDASVQPCARRPPARAPRISMEQSPPTAYRGSSIASTLALRDAVDASRHPSRARFFSVGTRRFL
jgi:hypothetical protein